MDFHDGTIFFSESERTLHSDLPASLPLGQVGDLLGVMSDARATEHDQLVELMARDEGETEALDFTVMGILLSRLFRISRLTGRLCALIEQEDLLGDPAELLS